MKQLVRRGTLTELRAERPEFSSRQGRGSPLPPQPDRLLGPISLL